MVSHNNDCGALVGAIRSIPNTNSESLSMQLRQLTAIRFSRKWPFPVIAASDPKAKVLLSGESVSDG